MQLLDTFFEERFLGQDREFGEIGGGISFQILRKAPKGT